MPTTETTQQSTIVMTEGRIQQNTQLGGKTMSAAAVVTTDSQADNKTESQAGSKDLMPSSKREAIKQNQACKEEAWCPIINLQVADKLQASLPWTSFKLTDG